MKAIILTEGGRNIGFGHTIRSIALYHSFESKGIISKIVISADETLEYFLEGLNYSIFNWLKDEREALNLIKGYDIVVIDSYLANESLYKEISNENNGCLVMIDDYNRLNYPNGIVINPSVYGEKINYSRNNDTTNLLGNDYIILRKEFWSPPKKIIERKIENVLMTFGGRGYSDLLQSTIKYLREFFNFNFITIDLERERFSAKQMIDLMLKADICISGGGQTLHELARIGLPTVGICFADKQLQNLKEWNDKGFLGFAGWHTDKSLKEKVKAIINEMYFVERQKMNAVGRKYVDGKGTERIVSKVLNHLKHKKNLEFSPIK